MIPLSLSKILFFITDPNLVKFNQIIYYLSSLKIPLIVLESLSLWYASVNVELIRDFRIDFHRQERGVGYSSDECFAELFYGE